MRIKGHWKDDDVFMYSSVSESVFPPLPPSWFSFSEMHVRFCFFLFVFLNVILVSYKSDIVFNLWLLTFFFQNNGRVFILQCWLKEFSQFTQYNRLSSKKYKIAENWRLYFAKLFLKSFLLKLFFFGNLNPLFQQDFYYEDHEAAMSLVRDWPFKWLIFWRKTKLFF